LSAGNANTVGHGLSSSKCPARSASALVSDLANGFALGPVLCGRKLFGDVLERFNVLEGESEVLGSLKSAHESLDGLEIHAVEVFVVSGGPSLLDGVDVVDDGLEVEEDLLVEFGSHRHC